MPLYSASSLIGKTIVLEKRVNIYRVADVNERGDNARPYFQAAPDFAFVVDSFLAITPGYTSAYGITYAARTVPYFTFFDPGGNYLAVAIVADGRFSLKHLREQGVLSISEQAAKDERDGQNFFDKLLKPINLVLFAAAAALIINATKKRQ